MNELYAKTAAAKLGRRCGIASKFDRIDITDSALQEMELLNINFVVKKSQKTQDSKV